MPAKRDWATNSMFHHCTVEKETREPSIYMRTDPAQCFTTLLDSQGVALSLAVVAVLQFEWVCLNLAAP